MWKLWKMTSVWSECKFIHTFILPDFSLFECDSRNLSSPTTVEQNEEQHDNKNLWYLGKCHLCWRIHHSGHKYDAWHKSKLLCAVLQSSGFLGPWASRMCLYVNYCGQNDLPIESRLWKIWAKSQKSILVMPTILFQWSQWAERKQHQLKQLVARA